MLSTQTKCGWTTQVTDEYVMRVFGTPNNVASDIDTYLSLHMNGYQTVVIQIAKLSFTYY